MNELRGSLLTSLYWFTLRERYYPLSIHLGFTFLVAKLPVLLPMNGGVFMEYVGGLERRVSLLGVWSEEFLQFFFGGGSTLDTTSLDHRVQKDVFLTKYVRSISG